MVEVQPPTWKQVASDRQGNVDLYSIVPPLRPSDLDYCILSVSTIPRLTEECIYKPSASGAIKHD